MLTLSITFFFDFFKYYESILFRRYQKDVYWIFPLIYFTQLEQSTIFDDTNYFNIKQIQLFTTSNKIQDPLKAPDRQPYNIFISVPAPRIHLAIRVHGYRHRTNSANWIRSGVQGPRGSREPRELPGGRRGRSATSANIIRLYCVASRMYICIGLIISRFAVFFGGSWELSVVVFRI